MQVAAVDYIAKGFLVDFTIIPSGASPSTFTAGTYYIQTSYYSGNPVTFSPDCVIKFKNNAYMLLSGTITFPATVTATSMPVFTSRNDDQWGEIIQGVANDVPNSDGNPTLHKDAQSLWVYYSTYTSEIRNARILWSKIRPQKIWGKGRERLTS